MFLSFLLVLISSTSVSSQSYADARSLYTHITGSVNKYLRPASDQTSPTNVTIDLYLKSIAGLDEVNGYLSTVLSLNLEWTDDTISWTPSSYGGMDNIKLDGSLIWVPTLLTTNPSQKLKKFGLEGTPAHIESTGLVSLTNGDLMETTCDVDVSYFPFDTQTCVIELISLGYHTDVNIIFRNGGNDGSCIFTTIYSENNLWILTSTKCEHDFLGASPYAKLTITLKRRYAFFILNLFSPVLIMCLLNLMVFMLPAESGERVGYAITCLLALSVYMTFASESLPISSKPIPIIISVLLAYIVLSSFMCFEVIIGLKLHMHEESPKPPKFLSRLCGVRCKRQRSIQASEDEKIQQLEQNDEESELAWKQIAHKFDMMCFGFNLLGMILLTVIYIGIVRSG